MSHGLKELVFLVALALVIVAVGCSGDESGTGGGDTSASTTGTDSHDDGGDEHAHAHPSEGPHHGALIEFGDHEYHGEFVHDAESVTIYILNAEATESVPIEAETITLNVIPEEGDPQQHDLAATPDEEDPEGKSSRFVLTSAEVVELIDAEGAAARVSVMIDGVSYDGAISHDHEGHDHSHE